MLPKKVTYSAAIALIACVTSAAAQATAIVARVHRSLDGWPAWIEIFALAAFMVGLGAEIFSYSNAPAKPRGWRPARRWTFERLAPAAAYFSVLILSLAIGASASAGTSELVWKVATGTASQCAFALLVWENWWARREFAAGESKAS
jgi:hypothetical protein